MIEMALLNGDLEGAEEMSKACGSNSKRAIARVPVASISLLS
jgi:hypothetical protein